MTNDESKKQILKSTGIVGSSQVFTIILQILRTKIIALLLGPTGVGLLGIYNSIVDMVRSVTGLGINFSGVREIAEAKATSDETIIAKKVLLLKRWSLITGIAGGVLLIIISYPLSRWTFDDPSYTLGICLLSIAVFFSSLYQTQLALLQGSRKLIYMAKASVIGVLLSIVIVTPIYYFWGSNGMVCAIILMSISSYILSYIYVSKIKKNRIVSLSLKDTWHSGKEMIKIGIASSISTIITTAAMYYIRSYISSNGSMEDSGFFQASWSISNVYLLSVLNAMAADYFPRLSAIHNDNNQVNRLVNDQTEIALLLGGFLVAIMLIFSSIIINLLYSTDFTKSITLLIFFSLGSFFKLISWPLGYVSAAKGAVKQIIISECSWNIFFISFSMLMWDKFGLIAIGISYILSYFIYVLIVFFFVFRLSRFRWTKINCQHILFYFFAIIYSAFFAFNSININWLQVLILPIIGIYSYYYLSKIINFYDIIKKIFKKK